MELLNLFHQAFIDIPTLQLLIIERHVQFHYFHVLLKLLERRQLFGRFGDEEFVHENRIQKRLLFSTFIFKPFLLDLLSIDFIFFLVLFHLFHKEV